MTDQIGCKGKAPREHASARRMMLDQEDSIVASNFLAPYGTVCSFSVLMSSQCWKLWSLTIEYTTNIAEDEQLLLRSLRRTTLSVGTFEGHVQVQPRTVHTCKEFD